MPKKDLEKEIHKKLRKMEPVIGETMHKFLGVRISELSEDISKRLRKSPVINFDVDTRLKFKKAKQQFKSWFLHRLLEKNYGNISQVARVADLDRRSVHRIVKGSNIKVNSIRKEMLKPDYYKTTAVSSIIEDVLDKYKEVIHPNKLQKVYQNVNEISKNIVKELPEEDITLREAEKQFEKKFLTKALNENNWDVKKTAYQIGLRYETLVRKMKKLGI